MERRCTHPCRPIYRNKYYEPSSLLKEKIFQPLSAICLINTHTRYFWGKRLMAFTDTLNPQHHHSGIFWIFFPERLHLSKNNRQTQKNSNKVFVFYYFFLWTVDGRFAGGQNVFCLTKRKSSTRYLNSWIYSIGILLLFRQVSNRCALGSDAPCIASLPFERELELPDKIWLTNGINSFNLFFLGGGRQPPL